jgi:hypothetical protein
MLASGPVEPKRRRCPEVLWAFPVVLAIVGLSHPVPAIAGDGDKVAAKAHYEAANKYYDLHEYEDAAKEYKAAYFAKPDPAFLFNIGQCYRRLGKPDQAVEFFREYLKKAPLDDPNRANAEARIREVAPGSPFEPDTSAKAKAPAQPAESPAESTAQPASPAQPSPMATKPPPAFHEPGNASDSARAEPALLESAHPAYPAHLAAPYPVQLPTGHQTPGANVTNLEPPKREETGTPVYRTWWFWTGIGAVVVAGTVTAIVLASGGSEPNSANAGLGTRGVFQ